MEWVEGGGWGRRGVGSADAGGEEWGVRRWEERGQGVLAESGGSCGGRGQGDYFSN